MSTYHRINPIGPIGQNVAHNITRLRKDRRMTAADLATQMRHLHTPIQETGVYRVENLSRKVSAEEIASLAQIFGVPVEQLLEAPSTCCGHNCQKEDHGEIP